MGYGLPEGRSEGKALQPGGASREHTLDLRTAPSLLPPSRVSTERARLYRQYIQDLHYWRALTRGKGPEPGRVSPDLTMHCDAADIGYGGTLGSGVLPGSRGLWEDQGFWKAANRAQSISRLELRADRLLFQRHFAAYMHHPEVRRRLLHEDNQAV